MDQQAIEGMADRDRGSRRRSVRGRSARKRIFAAVEAAFDVGGADLRKTTRGRCEIAFARQTGMYLARVTLGMTLSEAGHLFGRDRTTASHACRCIEDRRDDPRFDALLGAMESFVLCADDRGGSASR
jgi:chromosomal replication initiation ATPase DnaA